jgi:hypothetical protein
MLKTKICLICKKPFQTKTENQKYCCAECRNKKRKEMAKFSKEYAIYGITKSEVERLKQKAKRGY